MTLVSAVVPSIGTTGTVGGTQRTFVVESIRSVLATAHVDIEVIVVAGREMPSLVSDELRALGPVRIVDYQEAFNFSAVVNLGAAHATGEYLLLLNDDTEVIIDDWLTLMLAACEPGSARSVRSCCSRTARCSTPATPIEHRSTMSGSASPATVVAAETCSVDGARLPGSRRRAC